MRSAYGEGGHSQQKRGPKPARVGGRCPRELGAVAHEESWGPLPTRVGGRCPRELGAVAHEEREGGRCPRREGAVAHEEGAALPAKRGRSSRGRTRPTKGRGLAAKGVDDPHVKKGPAREDDYRPREGGPLRGRGPSGGERTCVVTERPRIPAPSIPPQRVLVVRSYPGPKSARLRSKNKAHVGAPGPLRRSESPGRYRNNSTEGALRS